MTSSAFIPRAAGDQRPSALDEMLEAKAFAHIPHSVPLVPRKPRVCWELVVALALNFACLAIIIAVVAKFI